MLRKISFLLLFVVVLATAGCTDINEKANDVSNNHAKTNPRSQNWKESPLFKSNGYTMIGENKRLGFIYDDSEVTRFYPNKKINTCGIFGGRTKN